MKTLLLWGNEIKLFEKKAHGKELFSFNYDAYCCIKGLNLWEGEELIPLPTPTRNKNTVSVLQMAGFQTVPEKELIPFRPSFRLLLFIPKFKDHDKDKKLSEPLPKGELGVGDKFEYPQKLTKNAWKLSFLVFFNKTLQLFQHCLLLAAVDIKPCLPLEARSRTAAAAGKILSSFCKFVVLVYSLQPRDWVYIQMQMKSAANKE